MKAKINSDLQRILKLYEKRNVNITWDETMELRKICISGIAAGAVLLIMSTIFSMLAAVIAPYDIFDLGGMRAANDPVMALFFLYPFIFALAAAVLFNEIERALEGDKVKRGIRFGLLLFVIFTIPNQFVIFSSMTYPPGFYIGNLLTGLVGFPVLGIVITTLWERL